MKLFYVVGTRDSFEGPTVNVALIEDLSTEYESSDIETYLSFETKMDQTDHKVKLALFSADEIEVLMSVKNKTITWGSKQMLKGMHVGHFDRLFGYVDNVEVKELEINVF